MRLPALILAVCYFACGVLLAQEEKQPVGSDIKEMWKLPKGCKIEYITTYKDRFAAIIFDQKKRKKFLIIDGRRAKGFKSIYIKPFFTKAGKLIYAVSDGKRYQMVIEDWKSKKYHKMLATVRQSPDGQRIAYIIEEANKLKRVVVNEAEGGEYGSIKFLTFSHDSQKFAYAGLKGGRWYLVEDHVEKLSCDEISEIFYLPQTNLLVCAGLEARGHFITIGDEKFRKVNLHFIKNPYDPKKRHLVCYKAVDKEGEYLIINGKKQKKFSKITQVVFSPTGDKLAYIVKHKDKEMVISGTRKGKRYNRISNLVFSPNGEYFIYRAEIKTKRGELKYAAVVNQKEGKKYTKMQVPFIFSPDGKRFAFKACRKDKYFYVVNNKEGKGFEDVTYLVFSKTGKGVAHVAHDKGKVFVVVKGTKKSPFDSGRYKIRTIWLSKQGKLYAYAVKDTDEKKYFAVIKTREGKKYDSVSDFVFSEDEKLCAYKAKSEGYEFAVLKKKECSKYLSVWNLMFSPDGSKFCYFVKIARQMAMIINEVQGPTYSHASPVEFTTDNKVVFVGSRGRNFYLVVDNQEEAYDKIKIIKNPKGKNAYQMKKGKKERVFFDGIKGKEFDRILKIEFNPSGRGISYWAILNNKLFKVVVER